MGFSRERERDGSLFKPGEYRFIKRIHDDIPENKPWIPRKFLRKIGNVLSKSATLEDPNGTLWRIELLKPADGMVRFQKGWQDFADFYSLKKGDLLVFEYKGNSRFSVSIYKEMDYPAGSIDSVSSNHFGHFEEDMEDEDYLEFLAKLPKQKPEVSYSFSKPASDSPSCMIIKSGRSRKKLKS